jgi:transcriptional regulator with XRE-family HTH domain
MENIRTKIRKARRDREISQRNLATKAGVSTATVQRAEYLGDISVKTLVKIAGALDIKLADFFLE